MGEIKGNLGIALVNSCTPAFPKQRGAPPWWQGGRWRAERFLGRVQRSEAGGLGSKGSGGGGGKLSTIGDGGNE